MAQPAHKPASSTDGRPKTGKKTSHKNAAIVYWENAFPGFPLPTWEQVRTVAARYETRDDERLVLDTRRDPDACVQEVLDYLDRA